MLSRLKKSIVFFFVLVWSQGWCSVITTNNLGEYFDLTANSVERYIYGQLVLTTTNPAPSTVPTNATLQIFSPLITAEITAEIAQFSLANIVVKPAIVTKSLVQIAIDKKLAADVEITFTPNFKAFPGYQATLSLLGQTLNTNVFSSPNPAQYFLLQMSPITAGITQYVYCDLFYGGKATNKWVLPPANNLPSQGLFASQTWKTPTIFQTKTNETQTLKFSLEIPLSSFIGLKVGAYQIRIAAVMIPPETAAVVATTVSPFVPTQLATLQKYLDSAISTAEGNSLLYVPTGVQLASITANIAFLLKLIVEISAANP